MRLNLILAAALSLCISTSSAQKPAEEKPEWAIVLHLTPKYQADSVWNAADKAAVADHFTALQKLQAAGKLRFAGRTTNAASLGFIILKNMSRAEALQVLMADQAVRRGIMSAELQPFHTALTEGK